MSTIKTDVKIQFKNGRKFKVNIESYASAQDVVQDFQNREVRHSNYDMKNESYSKSWDGVNSYNEALELMRLGYQPTVDKLQETLKANKLGTGKRISFENNVHGFAPIVPLALKGVPNSMVNMTMKPIKCKVINVYYDMGINADASSEDIIKAGQKLLGTIIELEKQGYRFNLYAIQAFSGEKDADILCVKVKSSDKPIDLKRISFPLTHPAFFRVIGFDWQGRSPITKYRGDGRGRALTSEIDDSLAKEFAEQAFGDNSVYLSCRSIKRRNEKYIKEVLTNDKSNNR